MIRLVLRPFLWTPLLLAISQLSICEAADHLWLDIDDTAQQTALLHLSLNPSSGSSASTNAGTLLTISGSPNFEFYSHTDLLLTDGAANSGPGASITLTLANLPAGTWTVESWHHQGDSVSGSIQIDFGPQGGSTTTLVNQEPFSTSGVSYQITTDGTSTYELHFTEDDANDRTCLNGLHIRPSSAGAFPPVLLTDVSPSNTTALGGSPSPFSSTSPTTGNLWRQRNGFGFDELGNGEVYEKDANGGNGNATILETTITGLTPNTDYGIYSAFLSVPNESWRIRMGLTSTEFTEFTPSSPAGRVLNLGITGVAGSNRHQYLGYLTNTTSNASGEITVFFDDGEGTTANSRTWLEGAAVGEPFFPPPPPPLPGGAVEVAPDGVWTWFNDERAIFHQGYLYSGYVRADGHVGLTRYNPATETSQHMTLSTSRAQEVDDHNNPSITVLPDDRLLVTYAKHNSAAEFYYRTSITTTPSSDSDWNAQQIRSTTNGSTYSNTYRLSSESDTIYNFSRSINFNPTLTTSTDNGASYNTPQHFISTGGGGTRPYPRYVSNDDDRIDLIYTDGHPRNNNNSIYHLHYHQNNFRLSDGTILKNISNLPIDHDANERGTVIYTYSSAPWAAGEGPDDYIPDARAWTWDIHYGSGGHPVCVFQAQVNNVTGGSWQDDRIYYYYARWTGTAWEKHFIAQAGRGIYSNERDYGGGMTLDPEDPRIVYISSNADSPFDLSSISTVPLNSSQRYEIYRGFTDDDGQTFSWEAITQNSSLDNLRPIVPKNHDRTEALVWLNGTYTTYQNYNTRVLTRLGSQTIDFAAFTQAESLSGSLTDDTDGDGITDLLEFALQSDPNDGSSIPGSNFDDLGLLVPSLTSRVGLDLLVESSQDLSNWEPAAIIRADHLPSEDFTGFSLEGSGMKIITAEKTNELRRFFRISTFP